MLTRQRDTLPSWKQILADELRSLQSSIQKMLQHHSFPSVKSLLEGGFTSLQTSVQRVKVLQDMVHEMNTQGQIHVMTHGEEMLADAYNALRKVTQSVKGLQDTVCKLNIYGESDAIAQGKEMLIDGLNVLQKAHLRVTEMETIIRHMNTPKQHAIQNPEAPPVHDHTSSANKKRTLSAQQDAEKFLHQVLTTGSASLTTGSASLTTGSASLTTGSASLTTGSASLTTGSASHQEDTLHSEKRARHEETPMLPCSKEEVHSMIPSVAHAMAESSATTVPETSPPRHEPADTMTSILVKNMPQDIKACELYDSFRPYGIIRKVCFPRNKNPHSPSYGKAQGFAFVTYETVSQADGAFKAFSTSGLSIRGMKLKIRRAYRTLEDTSPISPLCAEPITLDVTNSAASAKPLSSASTVSETSPSLPCEPENAAKNVIAKNVSPFITYSMLYERFCRYGNVLDVCLPKTDGEPRNVVIKYSTSRSAAHAVRCLHGLQLDGKKVTVELERETEATIRSEKLAEKLAEKPIEKCMKDREETPSALCAKPMTSNTSANSVSGSSAPRCEPAMTSIIVKNLPRNITLSELYEYFGRYGLLYDVYLPWNKDCHSPSYGTPDGSAFIAYETASEADRAFQAFSTRGRSMYGNQATVTKSYRETRF